MKLYFLYREHEDEKEEKDLIRRDRYENEEILINSCI